MKNRANKTRLMRDKKALAKIRSYIVGNAEQDSDFYESILFYIDFEISEIEEKIEHVEEDLPFRFKSVTEMTSSIFKKLLTKTQQ